jgi:hypothetical protein
MLRTQPITPNLWHTIQQVVITWEYARWSHLYRQQIKDGFSDLNRGYGVLFHECDELVADLKQRRQHDTN